MPGLLIQLGLFGSTFVGFAIISDWRAGVIERFRVTPVSRLAIMTGRVLRDVLTLVVQAVILVLVGVAFGLRAPVSAVLLSLGFIVLVAVGLASVSYATALLVKSEDAFAPMLNSVMRAAGAAVRDHAAADARARLAAGHRADQPVPVHHRRHARRPSPGSTPTRSCWRASWSRWAWRRCACWLGSRVFVRENA